MLCRISGLLKSSSTEVKLALYILISSLHISFIFAMRCRMTNEEAIDLLAHGAGLDFEELSAAMLEVVGLCGRLPL